MNAHVLAVGHKLEVLDVVIQGVEVRSVVDAILVSSTPDARFRDRPVVLNPDDPGATNHLTTDNADEATTMCDAPALGVVTTSSLCSADLSASR